MIENIVIGVPLIEPHHLLADHANDKSWVKKTAFVEESFLPQILTDLKLIPSNSWARKNKPKLVKNLKEFDFFELKLSKKKKPIHIIVGKLL